MESQIIKTPQIIINKDKNIGKVIYIVEGEKKEFTLLNQIFTKIFDYNMVQVKRNTESSEIIPYFKYSSKKNENSIIYVINTENSNISSISSGEEYLNKIFRILFEIYGLEPNKAAIYYLFDRDVASNKDSIIKELLSKLTNSIDNDEWTNGLLLLNYPCIESYIISCFTDNCHSLNITTPLKTYIDEKKHQQNLIKTEHLVNATKEMIGCINYLISHELKAKDIDEFSHINSSLYHVQEEYYKKNKFYKLLSLLSISFIDLNLIDIE